MPGRWTGGALLIVAALATAGCGIVNGITSERNSTDPLLQNYGFPSAKVTYSPSRPPSPTAAMTVNVVASPQTMESTGGNVASIGQQYLELAGEVWDHFAYSFTSIAITIKGYGTRTYPYADLTQYFGSRPKGFGTTSLAKEEYSAWSYIYDGGYAFGSLVVVLVIVKIYRRQKRKVAKVPVSEGKYGGWHHQMTHLAPHHNPPKTWTAPVPEPAAVVNPSPAGASPPAPGPPPVPVAPSQWVPPGQPGQAPAPRPAPRPVAPQPARSAVPEQEPSAGFARRPFARPGPPADVSMPKMPTLPAKSPPAPAPAETPGDAPG